MERVVCAVTVDRLEARRLVRHRWYVVVVIASPSDTNGLRAWPSKLFECVQFSVRALDWMSCSVYMLPCRNFVISLRYFPTSYM